MDRSRSLCPQWRWEHSSGGVPRASEMDTENGWQCRSLWHDRESRSHIEDTQYLLKDIWWQVRIEAIDCKCVVFSYLFYFLRGSMANYMHCGKTDVIFLFCYCWLHFLLCVLYRLFKSPISVYSPTQWRCEYLPYGMAMSIYTKHVTIKNISYTFLLLYS